MSIIWQDIKAMFLKLKRMGTEDRAGLYITVIFHLTVIIVLSATQIGSYILDEKSFVFDFSRQEAEEKRIEEEKFKESISRQLDEMIRMAKAPAINDGEVRNVAVDAGAKESSDKAENSSAGRDASASPAQDLHENAVDETVDLNPNQNKPKDSKAYKGPATVSYILEDRKASHLKVPAYKGLGSGKVTVAITVDPQGNVLKAKVVDAASTNDPWLHELALEAAKNSRFSKSKTAPSRQNGTIIYLFIAQ